MRKLIFVISIFLLLAAAALPQQSKTAAPKKPDSCALVTKAEIQEAVGGTVADGAPNTGNSAMCDYKVGDYGAISFWRRQAGPDDTADKMMAELKKRNIEFAEAKGIGDRSLFVSPGYGMVSLNTFKGTSYIILTALIPGAAEPKTKAICEKLMQKALTRL